jgi:hypothetical protein
MQWSGIRGSNPRHPPSREDARLRDVTHRLVGEVQLHDAVASSEPGSLRDQKQPCPDDDGPDRSRDALTGWCETFDGDRGRHDSHGAKVQGGHLGSRL